MTFAPRVTMRDVDQFSDQLNEFVAVATPDEIVKAVVSAARWIEDAAENGRPLDSEMDTVNNCTYTMCVGARVLANRLAEVPA